MRDRYSCDRCETKASSDGTPEGWIELRIGPDQYDLCDDCAQEFGDWMKQPYRLSQTNKRP